MSRAPHASRVCTNTLCAHAQSAVAVLMREEPISGQYRVPEVASLLPSRGTRGGHAMSRAGVGWVIDRMLTERHLRLRFALNPMETVVELYLRGVDLTVDEIDLLCRADACVWVPGDGVTVRARH